MGILVFDFARQNWFWCEVLSLEFWIVLPTVYSWPLQTIFNHNDYHIHRIWKHHMYFEKYYSVLYTLSILSTIDTYSLPIKHLVHMVCRPQDQYYHQQEETRVTFHNFKRYPQQIDLSKKLLENTKKQSFSSKQALEITTV